MTVRIEKPAINVREELADLRKPTGIAGEAMLRAETPQEQFNLIGAGRRNLIINGDMRIAQRGTSSASAGHQTVDRFYTAANTDAVVTQSQGTSNPPAGFSNYYRINVDTADTSIASSQYSLINYAVEGYDAACTAWGTTYAVPVTMSFWVRSNVTGTYATEIQTGTSPSYESCHNYTINNSGAWEKKTITFPPFTIASLNSTNGAAFYIAFWLAAGSTWNSGTISPQWTDPNSGRASGQVNVLNAANNYFDITGVQLELGKVATPFEHRSYGEELAACRRYYQIYGGGGSSYVTFMHLGSYNSNSAAGVFKLDSTMRTAPTVSTVGNFQASNYVTQSVSSFIGVTSYDGNLVTIGIQGNGSNFINGGMLRLRAENDTTARFMFDAEL